RRVDARQAAGAELVRRAVAERHRDAAAVHEVQLLLLVVVVPVRFEAGWHHDRVDAELLDVEPSADLAEAVALAHLLQVADRVAGTADDLTHGQDLLEPVRAADDVEHDLVGARADPVQAHVAPHALDAVLLHVAGAAVDLDALVGDLDRDPRGVQLRHRDLADRVLAVLEPPRGDVDHLPRRLDLRRHLGELVADHLELADLAAERGALLRVLQGAVEAALRAGDATGGADQPLALQLPHDVVEALADLAEHGG